MKKGKYDIIIMPIIANGRLIAELIQKRTAREAWETRIEMAEFRRLFYKSIEGSKAFRVPIIGGSNEA